MASSDLNCVALVGRLTRDAELSYLPSQTAVATFSIAVNRSHKDGDQWVSEANFFEISYFGKGAEAVKPYLTKGKQISVLGSLRQDHWTKDGQNFSKVKIVADSVQLLGGRPDGAPSNGGGYGSNGNGSYGNNGNGASGGYQQQSGYAPRPNSMSQGYEQRPGSSPDDSFGGDYFGGNNGSFSDDVPF